MAEQENGENGFLPGEQSPPPSIVDSTPATLDDLKKLESSIVSQMKAMMMELIAPKPTPIIDPKASVNVPPQQVNTLHLVDFVAASTELWRIIEEGYSPRDPKNLTRREVVDDQLNATAINMIHMAVTPKDRAHIRSLKTAKEAWNKLDKLFLANESIQSSRFDEVNNMADNFVMNEGESPEEMYRRLIALAVQMQDLGATFVDDPWIKRKFYNALLPYEEVKLTAIRQNASFRAMTSDEVLSEVIALDISKKNAEDLVARAHTIRKPNLALKMKEHEPSESDEDPIEWGPDDLKTNYHEHMALATKSFWSGNKTWGSRLRRYSPHDSSRYSSTSPREEQRGRACYNCGDTSHFVADCIFERREDNGGRLVRKDKFKSLSKGFSKFSSNSGDTKVSLTKKPIAFIIREEYSSDEGEEHKDKGTNKEEREVAAIAISTPSISLFDSPNENLIVNSFHCLVAKVSSETHDEELMTQLDATQDRYEAELEIISLTQAHEEELCMRMSLETSAIILEESKNSFISQLIEDQDHALGWLRRHNARLLDIISRQEEALDEYFRLSKEKVSCCDHEEEIAALKRHKAKLVEVNDRQNESLMEWIRLSKEKSTCFDHEEEIAALKRSKANLMEGWVLALADLESYLLRVPGKDEVPPIWSHLHHKAKLLPMNNQVKDHLFHNLKFGINNNEGQGEDLNHDEDQGTTQESILWSILAGVLKRQDSFMTRAKYKTYSRARYEGVQRYSNPKHLEYRYFLNEPDKTMESFSTCQRQGLLLYLCASHPDIVSRVGSSKPRSGAKVKPRRQRDQEEQEEILPQGTTKRQRAAATAADSKRTTSGPQKSMKDLKKAQFLQVRGVNPYLVPKNSRLCPNNFFYHADQERIYNDVYGSKEFRCCPQYSINMDKLQDKPEYFGEALEICEEQGLIPLMTFSHNFSKEVICQFYATVVFLEDEGGFRTLKWMTKEYVMEATWQEFARGIGYDLPDNEHNFFRIHLQAKPMAKEKMANLYIPGRMLCGSAYNLLPVYDIMNRIYRSTINPKDTNHDEVHGFLVNLLVRTDEMRGRGRQLDVMDFIWHEMRDCAFLRKLPQYAPFIMRLICLKWDQEGRGDLLEQCRPNITVHKEKSPLVKNHDPPRLFAKLTARLKKSFCFKEDLQDKMYQAHRDNKKIRQRQKAMMKHMDLPVSEGSEDNITPPGEWKSKYTWSSSEDSILERVVRPSPPPHGKGQVEDEDEDEEDEDEDKEMDEEEEENDEEGDDDDDEDDE
ncbi:hypothetical protein QYE76_053661 [Lolium multiflorum]|uniref:CCHC-type domain-containing protein n=1 Tax=Lolium multiflorum TaxID=4521 RepID=A0AAD8SWR2_LOLMU|nr:hypothetical protein QYE76_053661 [Lolium multiflorum]